MACGSAKTPLEMLAATCNNIGQSDDSKDIGWLLRPNCASTDHSVTYPTDLSSSNGHGTGCPIIKKPRTTLKETSVPPDASQKGLANAAISPAGSSDDQVIVGCSSTNGQVLHKKPAIYTSDHKIWNGISIAPTSAQQVLPPTLPITNDSSVVSAPLPGTATIAFPQPISATPASSNAVSYEFGAQMGHVSPYCRDPCCNFCQNSHFPSLPSLSSIGHCSAGCPQCLVLARAQQMYSAYPYYPLLTGTAAVSAIPPFGLHSDICPSVLPGSSRAQPTSGSIPNSSNNNNTCSSVNPSTTFGTVEKQLPSHNSQSNCRQHRCNWILSEGVPCGKTYDSSKELLDHVFTCHTSIPRSEALQAIDMSTGRSAVGPIPPNGLNSRRCSLDTAYFHHAAALANSYPFHMMRTNGIGISTASWPMSRYTKDTAAHQALLALYGYHHLSSSKE